MSKSDIAAEFDEWDADRNNPMTPDKLRFIADYLDLADEAINQLAQLTGQEPRIKGDNVQQDLRRWAWDMESAEKVTDD